MSNLATTDDENSQVATGVTTPSIATAGATFAAVVAVPINATRTTRAAEQRNIRTRYNGALRSTSDESNNVVNSNGNNELMPYHNANNNIGNDSNASRILIDNSSHNAVSSNRNSNSNNNNNNALNFRALNGFHNLNGFHGNGITTPTSITVSNSNTLQEQQQQTTTSVTATTSTTESTTTSNGDLVVCHEALANLRVFRVTNNNVVNSNSNRNGADNGNNSQSENTEHQSTVTGTYRGRVRHRLRRDIHYMRRSLKSMNKILVKTVNTLRRLKMLILQQVQLSRALHLGSQLTM